MPPANFALAVQVVLQHEGTPANHWVNDPNDAGGETCWGISTLIIDRLGLTNAELGLPEGREPGWLKALTVETATKVYKRVFWIYDGVRDQTIATKIFDASVNLGEHHAITLVQEALNDLGCKVVVDGIYGPNTEAALNNANVRGFLVAFTRRLIEYYQNLVVIRPQNAKFLSNWLKRAQYGI